MDGSSLAGYIRRWFGKRRDPGDAAREAKAQSARSSVHDEITGVYREAYFMALLEQERARAQRGQGTFCVGVASIDGFDVLIDYYGPAAGESVLRHVGAAIAVELRNADAVGRYGEEEFAFVLFHTGLDNASIPAERVRRRIAALDISTLRPARKISVSIGLAEFKPGEEVAALIERATSGVKR